MHRVNNRANGYVRVQLIIVSPARESIEASLLHRISSDESESLSQKRAWIFSPFEYIDRHKYAKRAFSE
jgi:hypothetical protein